MLHPTPAEHYDMFEVDGKTTLFTLILFHVQDYFVKEGAVSEDQEEHQLRSKIYLNRVAAILDNHLCSFSHICIVNDRHPSVSEEHCVEGSVEEAVYGPLQEALTRWAYKTPNATTTYINGPCCVHSDEGKTTPDIWMKKQLEDMVLAFQTKTMSLEHHIVVAGLFDHECSRDNVSYLIETLSSPASHMSTDAQKVMLHLLAPHDADTWSAVAKKQFDLKTNKELGKDHGRVFVTMNLIQFDAFELDVEQQVDVEKMIEEQARVNRESFFFAGENMPTTENTLAHDYADALKISPVSFSMDTSNWVSPSPETLFHRSLVTAFTRGKADPMERSFLQGSKYALRVSHAMGKFHAPAPRYNPIASSGLDAYALYPDGMGYLQQWGPNQEGNLIRYCIDNGQVFVVLEPRSELRNLGYTVWAIPGSFCQESETAAAAAQRAYNPDGRRYWDRESFVVHRGWAPDDRNTREAWVETTCFASKGSKDEISNELARMSSMNKLLPVSELSLGGVKSGLRNGMYLVAGHAGMIQKLRDILI